MDVLLIKPDFNDIAIMPPLGLGYLASVLTKNGLSAKIYDNTLFKQDNHAIARFIKYSNPIIVGISAVTPVIERGLEIAALVKSINKNITVVLGGPHPSSTIEETLSSRDVDVIVVGEGEQTLLEIVLNIKGGNKDLSIVKGCAYKNSVDRIIFTEKRKALDDLDSLGFPDFSNMPLELYFRRGVNFGILQKSRRSLPIMASRGCPSKCIFCQRFLGESFRRRSAENIVSELEYLKNKFGVFEFNFLDDNFTLDKKLVIEVCDLIHKKGLKISFRFPNGVREDTLDLDALSALSSVGCYHLDFGIESGSQRILNIMKKGKRLDNIAEKVCLCKKYGFKLSASFLFGTPGETIEDMLATIKFANSLPLDSASFAIVIPFPGTEVRMEAINKGYLIERPYRFYNPAVEGFRALIETPEWSGSDLIRILKKANRSFFLRPKQIFKLLPAMLNPANSKRYAGSIKELFLTKYKNA